MADFPISHAAATTGTSAIRDLLVITERPDVISLAGGLPAPDSFPGVELGEAIAAVLADDPGTSLQYSTTQGHRPLREWVAARHERSQPDDVVITHGSQQALDLIARATLDPGGVVALADPGYVGAIQAFRLAGAELAGIPSDGDGMRVDVLEERLAAGLRPVLVYVVANFDNPTGATLAEARRVALAGLADRYGFVVVEDDPYGHLRWSGEMVRPVRAFSDRVISLGTISKVVCPGLRVGYAVAPPAILDALVLVKQAVDLHTATLSQRAVHALLERPGFLDAHMGKLKPLYQGRAAALLGALRTHLGDRISFNEPHGGMFVWAHLHGVDTQALLPAAVDAGMAFVPGPAFAVDEKHTDSLRLSFATATPNELDEAIRRLASVLL